MHPSSRLHSSNGDCGAAVVRTDQVRLRLRLGGGAQPAVFLLTSPALALYFHEYSGWSWLWSIVAALAIVIVARGVTDLFFRRRSRGRASSAPT